MKKKGSGGAKEAESDREGLQQQGKRNRGEEKAGMEGKGVKQQWQQQKRELQLVADEQKQPEQ